MGIFDNWEDHGILVETDKNGIIILKKELDIGPGTERGLVSKSSYSNIDLSFDVKIECESCFIAKIHQVDKFNQKTNSYHLMCDRKTAYFARHHHIFKRLELNQNSWEKIRIVYDDGRIFIYKNEKLVSSFRDQKLKRGYAFIGIKGGKVLLRNITINDLTRKRTQTLYDGDNGRENYDYKVLHEFTRHGMPRVSIITTVYDRVRCLTNCIKSVKRQTFNNYEHIIASDSPPENITQQLKSIVEQEDTGRIKFVNLNQRYNNWGITPAAVGLNISSGKYISFLSDDNGYTPDHVETLVTILEDNPNIGFVYSSCLYAGKRVLRSSVPSPGGIDLGQPMFRRELFKKYLQDSLPFNMFAWDWHLIDHLMKKGVTWKHIDKPTFIFRLAEYPQFIV